LIQSHPTTAHEFLTIAEGDFCLLQVATQYGSIDAIKCLVEEAGVSLKARSGDRGVTPLHCCVEHDHHDIAHYLLGAGLRVDVLSTSRYTVLDVAVIINNVSMIRLLVQVGVETRTFTRTTHTYTHKYTHPHSHKHMRTRRRGLPK
jgi:ankyrin repeat protein